VTAEQHGVAGRKRGLRVSVVAACLTGLACASLGLRSRDYMFAVTVLVLDQGSRAVPEAVVSLTTEQPVFEAVTPVTTVHRPTDSSGGCIFMYIAHQPSVRYRVKVQKEGFLPQEVSGVAPPNAHLRVELKHAGDRETLQNNEMQLTRSAHGQGGRGPRS